MLADSTSERPPADDRLNLDVIIPRVFFDSVLATLNGVECKLLCYLFYCTPHSDSVPISLKALAKGIGESHATVVRGLGGLLAKGMIAKELSRTAQNGYAANTYRILWQSEVVLQGSDPKPRRDRLNRLIARYGPNCLACGSDQQLTADHVIPTARGGSGKFDNLQLLCQPCNSHKYTASTDYRP